MAITAIASGTVSGTTGGVVLASIFTPGLYQVEVDCVNLIANGAAVQVIYKTSVKPVFSGSGAINQAESINRNAANPQLSHLFTHPRQVNVVENQPATYTLVQQGNSVTFDWTLYRLD